MAVRHARRVHHRAGDEKLGHRIRARARVGFIVTAAVSMVFERLLYSRLYKAAELDQVLFTIGLVFIFISAVTLIVGPENQPLFIPDSLRGQLNLAFFTTGPTAFS